MIFKNDKWYEILRWIVTVVIPAAILFYGVIGNTCNIPHTDIVLTIAAAFETFLGSIFGFSKIAYDKEQKYLEEINDN